MKDDEAQTVALSALGFLAFDEGALARLMNETGLAPESLRAGARDPELLGAVLDFLFADETLFLDFCRAESMTPGRVIRARAALPGGAGDWA